MEASADIGALERRFHSDMLDIDDKAKRECHYTPARFIQMVHEYGGLETAKRLLAGSEISYGLMQL